MLSLKDLEAYLVRVQVAANDRPDSSSEVRHLTEEADAYVVQARDAGLLSKNEEIRAREIQLALMTLRGVPAGAEGRNDRLNVLHAEFAENFKAITKVHSFKSIENYLQSESDRDKRRRAFEAFRQATDRPDAYFAILKILNIRGSEYATSKMINFGSREIEEIDSLIARVVKVLQPFFRKSQLSDPWDFYYEFAKNDISTAGAPVHEYKNAVFQLIAKEFRLRLIRTFAPTYHKDVEVYEIYDEQNGLCGVWHVDLFRRPGKYKGAWTQVALSRRIRSDGTYQVPLIFLGFDLAKDSISFHESRTLLHEIGHALEQCLSGKGINFLTPEVSEIASLYMESYMTNPSLLSLFEIDPTILLQQRCQQKVLDLAKITLLAKIDLELHRKHYRTAEELKKWLAKCRANFAFGTR